MSLYYRGNGFIILKKGEKYFISWEVGAFGKSVAYEISKENADKAKISQKNGNAVMIYAESGRWPQFPEENNRLFVYQFPSILIRKPDYQRYFPRKK